MAAWKSPQEDQQDLQLDDSIPTEGGSFLACESSLTGVLDHIVRTQVWGDARQFVRTFAVAFVSSFVALAEACQWSYGAVVVTFNKFFDCCVDLLRDLSSQTQAGFTNLQMNLAEFYRQISLPENSISQGVVIILTCTLLTCFLVTVVRCRRYKQQGMRNSPDNYQANSYDYTANSHTPLSERYQIQSRAYSPSFEPNCGHNAMSVRSASSGLDPPTVWDADWRSILNPMLMLMYVLLSLLFVSIPWEFCRLYQLAVSSRAAVASAVSTILCLY